MSANDGRKRCEVLGLCVGMKIAVEMRGAVVVAKLVGYAVLVVKHVLVGGGVQAWYVSVRWSAKCIGYVPQFRYVVAERVPWQLRLYLIGELAGSWMAVGCCRGVLASSPGSRRQSQCRPG
jgi:hypothetical protein